MRIILFQVASSSNEYRDWWKLKCYAASIISHDQASIWLLWQMSSREPSWELGRAGAGAWAEESGTNCGGRRAAEPQTASAVISWRCEEYCLLLLQPHGSGCYWKISTFRTVMAAPDTRYSARQFNFNQRMVLMILLYISRNGVGDKRTNLACRSCCLGLKSYLEAACPNNHWMPYYQLFVAVLGLLLMMVAHWLVVFQAVPRWVCAACDESCCSWSRWDYPCCCHEVSTASRSGRGLQLWHHCA